MSSSSWLAGLAWPVIAVLVLWVAPVALGLYAARRKKLSPHWMWFGVHPCSGWIACIVLLAVPARRLCGTCARIIPAPLPACPYCTGAFVGPPPAPYRRPSGRSMALGVGAAALGLAVLAAIIVALVMTAMRHSAVYEGALERARRSEALVQALGSPIEPGFFCSGSIQQHNDDGQAELSFSLHGPRGEARVKLEAVRQIQQWEYQRLVAVLPDGRRVDLLAADGAEAL